MPLPRVRFTMRRMAFAVVVVAVLFEAARAYASRMRSREDFGELLAAVTFVATLWWSYDLAGRVPTRGHRSPDPPEPK